MHWRFIEVEDEQRTNWGKFLLFRFGPQEWTHKSEVSGTPLLRSLPPMHRFGGQLGEEAVFLVDLQTREGMFFDPSKGEAAARREFLYHPIHVCLLFFPLMSHLARMGGAFHKLPKLVRVPLEEVVEQPGVLVDLQGRQVHAAHEWSRRAPLVARLWNREVAPEEDGQDVL